MKMKISTKLLFIFTLAMTLATFARADDQTKPNGNFNAEQSGEIEQIVREYLLGHPEILRDMSQKLDLQQQQAEEQRMASAGKAVQPVSSEDHIRGNIKAPVKVIEFSDFECPYCKSFHASLQQMMAEYGKDGQVAWVFRHFPIDELHSKARKEAQAAECANELGGNDAFWAYADRLFEIAPSNNRLDLAQLPQIAEFVHLDKAKFTDCLSGDEHGGKYAAHIAANQKDGAAAGGSGTPYTLVIGPKGKIFPINGAMPYSAVKAIIDAALK
jgi:protein-disulfide isomerase